MTVNTTLRTAGPYTGNGVASVFAYSFPIAQDSELVVVETTSAGVASTLELGVGYTVTGAGGVGGTVTRVAGALPSAYTWLISGQTDFLQQTDFGSQGQFFPQIHEAALDKLTKGLLDVNAKVVDLPGAERADMVYSFDENGDGEANISAPDLRALMAAGFAAGVPMTTDDFIGDGTTTAFVLSVSPLSVNAVLVIIDGVSQNPTTYSISGSTLTFSEAPPLNSDIVVRNIGAAKNWSEQEDVGAALWPQNEAEGLISVTPTRYSTIWFHGARYGISESNSAATNTGNFHDMINVARNARRQIVELEEGVFDMLGPALAMYDATYNNVTPSDARSQRMTIRGKGMGDSSNYRFSEPYGTVLNFTNTTGDGLVLANGTGSTRVGLQDICIQKPLAGAFTGILLKMHDCPAHSFLERVMIGGGKMATPGSAALSVKDVYTHVKLKNVHIVGNENDRGGAGFIWSTDTLAGSLFEIDGLTSIYWEDAVVLGQNFNTANKVYNTLRMKNFQCSTSVRGLTAKHGLRQLLLNYAHFEGNDDYDVKVFHSACRTADSPDTFAGLLHLSDVSFGLVGDSTGTDDINLILGDSAGTDDEDGYGDVLLERVQFNQVTEIGLRRYFGPRAGKYIERDCRWDSNGGYARVIDDVNQGVFEVHNPNYQGTVTLFPTGRRLSRASDLADVRHRASYYSPDEVVNVTSNLDLSAQTYIPTKFFLNSGTGNITLTLPEVQEDQRDVTIICRGVNEGIVDAGSGNDIGGRGQTITMYEQHSVLVIGPDSTVLDDWVVKSHEEIVQRSSSQLNAIAGSINTSGKYAGRQVWNTTVDHFVWAFGPAAADIWVSGSGATINTPV